MREVPRGVAGRAADGGPVMASSFFHASVNDDAGKQVRLLDPAGMSEWPSKGDERMGKLVKKAQSAMSRWPASAWIIGIGAFLGVVASIIVLSLVIPWINSIAGGLFVVALQGAGYATWRLRLRAGSQQVTRLLLQEGLCPCCGYNFVGLNIEKLKSNEIVVCPECGSSWRRGRIDRAVPFAAGASFTLPTRQLMQQRGIGGDWRITDDADAHVPLVHPWLMKPLDFVSSREHRARLLEAKAIIRGNRRWIRVLISCSLYACAVTAVLLAAFTGIQWVPLAFIVAIVCVVLGVLAYVANFAYSPVFIRATMLEHDLCPSCGADLAATSPGGTGLVMCPACRSEWKPNEKPASG